MATKSYFLIACTEDAKQNGYAEWLKEVEAMPEVRYAVPVTGLYDAVALVEAPVTAVLVAHKMLAGGHVKHLHVLRVQEAEKSPSRLSIAKQREIIRARRGEMQRFLRPAGSAARER